MQESDIEAILSEYDSHHDLNDRFRIKLSSLINELLSQHRLKFHSIDSRVKKRDSLRDKLGGFNSGYKSLAEITDIVGLRIITYFEDDVAKVAEVIEKEFEIDRGNSIDKRDLLDPDRFGYLSLHYVVNISSARLHFPEYKDFSGCKAEIQIRSILQHAWAEIEHDLGYKNKLEVPKTVSRQFYRLASLLELADKEFCAIRKELTAYEAESRRKIGIPEESIKIDKVTLAVFLKLDPTLRKIDEKIAINAETVIQYTEASVDIWIATLHYFGFGTIADIVTRLEKNKDTIIAFAKKMIPPRKYLFLPAGIGLGYLLYVLLAQEKSGDEISSYLRAFNIGDEPREKLAENILETYNFVQTQKEGLGSDLDY